MNVWDLTNIITMQQMFWHIRFYAELYLICLFSLVLFWKKMQRGRRFFLQFSIICMVLFVYNPVFVNLTEKYLLRGDAVIVRLFLLLPVLFVEAYVFSVLISNALEKSKVLAVSLTVAIVSLLLFFGITPWQRQENGWETNMYLLAENPYKIPQEHLDICNVILDDMDGERAILSMYEIRGINDIGGTLNYSIRMYTSRLQLDEVIDLESYLSLSDDEKMEYWYYHISYLENCDTDNSSIYFIFPKDDERITDLLSYGCYEIPVDSDNYQVLAYSS